MHNFAGKKYQIKVIDHPSPKIHPPHTVPVHILQLYKAKLNKMIIDDVIAEVTASTDGMSSSICNIKETAGSRNVRLCPDPKDLNRNTWCWHYYSRTTDEILSLLHGKKKLSVSDTILGVVTYLRWFSPKLAELIKPLHQMTKKYFHFRYEPHHQAAWTTSRKRFLRQGHLLLWVWSSIPIILHCDACLKCLGTWIRQKDSSDNEKTAAIASKVISGTLEII